MQANPPTYYAPKPVSRKNLLMLVGLVVVFLVGAAAGYLVARAAVREATLAVTVTNASNVAQNVQVFLNDDQVSTVSLGAGSATTMNLVVGWTSTTYGMFEVRARPVTTPYGDSEVKTVSNGQTVGVSLTVR